MKNFIEVHTNYKDEEPLTQLLNIAHIVRIQVIDTKTYIELTSFDGDSDGLCTDRLCVMESYDEVKQAIIIAQVNLEGN